MPFIIFASTIFILWAFAMLIALSYPKEAKASEITAENITHLVNNERILRGLKPLKVHYRLRAAAISKSQDMADNGYFAHKSPTGADMWDMVGYRFGFHDLGQNLARDYGSAEEVVAAWMNSPKHKENIVFSGFKTTGVGVVQNKNTILITQFFAD